jgi:outer membrane autotransporter protein
LTPAIVGTLPIGPVELYAKAGLMFYNVEVNDDTDNLLDDSGSDPVYGVGIGFTFAERLNLRAEYERIDIEEFDEADAVWIGLNWRF